MAIHVYGTDFTELDWSDLPALSNGDVVDGAGATFTAKLTATTTGVTYRNFTIDVDGAVGNCFSAGGIANITLQDAVLENASADAFVQGLPAESANGLSLLRVTAVDAGNDGFQLGHPTGGGITGLRVRDITAIRSNNVGVAMWNCPSADVLGVTIIDSGSTGNLDGLAVDDGCEGSTIDTVRVTGQKSGQAVDIQDSTGSTTITVRNVLIENPAAGTVDGFTMTGTSPVNAYNITVIGHRYNVVSKSTVAHVVRHLASINATEHGVRVGLIGSDGTLTLQNSVVRGAASTNVRVQENEVTSSTYTGSYNLFDSGSSYYWKGSTHTDYAAWATASGESNSSEVVEAHLDSDYRTTWASPAYRAGVNVAGLHDTVANGKTVWSVPPSMGRDDGGLSFFQRRRRAIR